MRYESRLLLVLLALGGCASGTGVIGGDVAGVGGYGVGGAGVGAAGGVAPARPGLAVGLVRVGRGSAERSGSTSLLGAPASTGAALSGGRLGVLPDRLDPVSLAGQVLREANATRRQHGAGVLRTDPALTRAAVRYAQELARREEIEHRSSTPGRRTFRDRIEAEGARARLGGENLARLTSSAELLGERVVSAWLRSPGHRFNLLDPSFARTGIGVWLGGDGVWYVVQVYATGS